MSRRVINGITIDCKVLESERVSTERLFRVRAKQPNTSSNRAVGFPNQLVTSKPVRAECMVVGELCAFRINPEETKLGKILQFVN